MQKIFLYEIIGCLFALFSLQHQNIVLKYFVLQEVIKFIHQNDVDPNISDQRHKQKIQNKQTEINNFNLMPKAKNYIDKCVYSSGILH